MPHVVINHGVEDVERWLKGKAERAAQISKFGSHVTDHVAMDGSKTVAVTADIDDLAALQAALASPPQDLPGRHAAPRCHPAPDVPHREVARRGWPLPGASN